MEVVQAVASSRVQALVPVRCLPTLGLTVCVENPAPFRWHAIAFQPDAVHCHSLSSPTQTPESSIRPDAHPRPV